METSICSPENRYSHPYKPYDIQIQLMDAIYDTIDNGYKIGLFESPTGTGKTLSIICSTMTWLRDYKRENVFQPMAGLDGSDTDDLDSDDEPEWVKKAYRDTIVLRSENKMVDYEMYLEKIQNEYENNIQTAGSIKSSRPPKKKRSTAKKQELHDEDFLPEDYYSDSEVKPNADKLTVLESEISQLLDKVNGRTDEIEMTNDCPVNIYFSSRTHSQLNQFAHQLALTKFQSSFKGVEERTKYLPIGSRKQLCINEKVKSFSKNDLNINDVCVDLQKSKEGCQFLPKDYLNSSLTKKLSDLSLSKIHDIEEIADLGSNMKVCPYYLVRKGVEMTEIISLPYQILLLESTRAILNLQIEDSIVVIDEAHNLMDTITSMHSVCITIGEMNSIIKALKFYLGRFLKKLNSGNRIHLMKLIKLCQLVISFIQKLEKCNNIKVGNEINTSDIYQNSTGDMLNIHILEAFLAKSKIAYKIESYMEKVAENENEQAKTSSSNPLLYKIVQFLKCLVNPSKEGKFFWDSTNGITSIKYMLLDPSSVFKDIVSKARCVILCGGTMEPMSEFKNFLFPYVEDKKIKSFSCNHIIPPDNLKVYPVSSQNNVTLEFLFDNRNNPLMIEALGASIVRICQLVPDGVVVFFPSYKYMNHILSIWKSTDVLTQIESQKKLFEEPTSASQVQTILADYANTIKEEKKGAILFSVVGGKMSEGINFADELGRAVVMVGLPYPNAYSGEIIAKRKFIESEAIARGCSMLEAQRNSQSYYENLCMRAVNQSIGRSIRHINDYSIIYLVDCRYQSSRIQNKLSSWVRKRIETRNYNMDQIMEETRDFFMCKTIARLA